MKSHARTLAKRDEIEVALSGLGDADLLRLHRFAQIRSRHLPGMDWEDLLQEAVARVLDGRRGWPRAVDFVLFMKQTIRSIASEHWRRHLRQPVDGEYDPNMPVQNATQSAFQPERASIAINLLEEIQRLFAQDAQVLAILAGLADDESPHDIQSRFGMTATEYASAQKRIRRGLARTFSTEGSSP